MFNDRSLSDFRAEVERGVRYARPTADQSPPRASVKAAVRGTEDAVNAAASTAHAAMSRDRFLSRHAKSADLIRHSAARGMSRPSMERIWGWQLVNAVMETTS
jgi:hypothetical protein